MTPAERKELCRRLAIGNANRTARAKIKADIKAGAVTVTQAMNQDQYRDFTRGMTLADLLRAQPQWGRKKVARFLRKQDISHSRRVGQLTPRQVAQVSVALMNATGGHQ